jgi:hypothetical protein
MKVTRVALHIAAAILSTSVAASQLACDSVERPTSGVSMSETRAQGTSRAAPDQRLPDSRSPDVLIPDATTVVPAEFNFNITLTLRPNSGSPENHRVRWRGFGFASCIKCPLPKPQPIHRSR